VEKKRISRSENAEENEECALHTRNYNLTQKPARKTQNWPSKKKKEMTHYKKKVKCFSCGEWGHISRNCKEAKIKNQNSAKIAIAHKHLALSTLTPKEHRATQWILNSGATEHMTSDRNKFSEFKSYHSTEQVANVEKMEVTVIRNILMCVSKGTTITLT
jgi:hypothetical protein